MRLPTRPIRVDTWVPGWNTSPAKVVDNAIVGYCRETLLDRASDNRSLIARAKELGIYDQIVAEAKKHQR